MRATGDSEARPRLRNKAPGGPLLRYPETANRHQEAQNGGDQGEIPVPEQGCFEASGGLYPVFGYDEPHEAEGGRGDAL